MAKRKKELIVLKRDGREIVFSSEKIFNALKQAFSTIKGNNIDHDDDIMSLTSKIIRRTTKEAKNNRINVETIQDVVEDVLLKAKENDVAKEYIRYRAKRTQIRDANNDLMRLYDDIYSKSAEDLEIKRDNANVNGNSSMGVMLKIGSEGNKHFLLNHYLKDEYAQAHKEGYLHFHDLDFSLITMNCLKPDTQLIINENGKIIHTDFNHFDGYFQTERTNEVVSLLHENLLTLSLNGKFTKINSVMRRWEENEIYKVSFNNGAKIYATADHLLTVNDDELKKVADLKIKDTVAVALRPDEKALALENDNIIKNKNVTSDESVIENDNSNELNLEEIQELFTCFVTKIELMLYQGYVYDFETQDHHFAANGIISHNCCQLNLEKLFSGGFFTGHGFIREPNSIRSYAALAAIAIQSNQNDQSS